jgi:hypothetical protein
MYVSRLAGWVSPATQTQCVTLGWESGREPADLNTLGELSQIEPGVIDAGVETEGPRPKLALGRGLRRRRPRTEEELPTSAPLLTSERHAGCGASRCRSSGISYEGVWSSNADGPQPCLGIVGRRNGLARG